jgi:hypothetical protein
MNDILYLHKKVTQQDNRHKSLLYLIESMTMVKMFILYGTKIGNKVHEEIKEATNCNMFKHRLKERFFKDLNKQEDNIYISTKIKFIFYMFSCFSFLSCNSPQRDHNGNKVIFSCLRYLFCVIPAMFDLIVFLCSM